MLDAFRIQAAAGPVTDKALQEIIFRGAQGVLGSLRPYSREQRVALLPSVVRLLRPRSSRTSPRRRDKR